MSEFLFSAGEGWLPKRAETIARRHGATLVNYTDAQCRCDRGGCSPYTCKGARRHWFASRNLGDPFNRDRAAAVLSDLRSAGLIPQEAKHV